jgi:hypothetical protein
MNRLLQVRLDRGVDAEAVEVVDLAVSYRAHDEGRADDVPLCTVAGAVLE